MEFSEEYLKNPEIFCLGAEAPHSDHRAFRSEEELAAGESSLYRSLDGEWYFSYAKRPADAVRGFADVDASSPGWGRILVPGHIQLQGYGKPQYVNQMYPWDGIFQVEPGETPMEWNPTGTYVRYEEFGKEELERRCFLTFDGVESCVALMVNGHFVGYSEDSFTPAEFEITDYVKEGRNQIAARVWKWCSGSWLEDQDFWRFSGIFRSVRLFWAPEIHIRDLKVETETAQDGRSARVHVELTYLGERDGGLRACLYGGDRELGRLELEGLPGEVSFPVENPELWSCDRPYLYRLRLCVLNTRGQVCEAVEQKVGIRRFEMKDGLMRLNGKRIVFKGVNRHEFSCTAGRAVTEEEIRADLLAMKRSHINAVRTCHYPNQSVFYDLCDELGLYVMDEANLETHGTWMHADGPSPGTALPGSRKEWLPAALARAEAVLQRDKNHPCVLIWSCGNESFGGSVIYQMSEYFRGRDPGRLVHYEGVFRDPSYPATSDMVSRMYVPAEEIPGILRENPGKPLICCEYAHAMGTSLGALERYTRLTLTEPRYQGGFIWDFLDQTLLRKDPFGKEYLAYGGDFGDRPCDYEFCANGLFYGDRIPTPKLDEASRLYQDIRIRMEEGRALIDNQSLSVDTGSYEAAFLLYKDGKEAGRWPADIRIAPEGSGEVPYPFGPEAWEEAGHYVARLVFRYREDTPWSRAGEEAAFGEWSHLVKAGEGVHAVHAGRASRPPRLIRGDYNYGVGGDGFHILFSRTKGGIVSYVRDGEERIGVMPAPNFWRAMTDNDRGWGMGYECGFWKLASLYARPVGTEAWRDGERVAVRARYSLGPSAGEILTVEYRVDKRGAVEIAMGYDGAGELPPIPEFGILLRMPARYDRFSWYGRGPGDSYSDRKEGSKMGIYSERVGENACRYARPQESGNKTDVRWAEVTDRLGRGFRIAGDGLNVSALPYTPFEAESALHPYELPPHTYTSVRVSAFQMGIGGDNSWGARPLPEYMLPSGGPFSYSFILEGI